MTQAPHCAPGSLYSSGQACAGKTLISQAGVRSVTVTLTLTRVRPPAGCDVLCVLRAVAHAGAPGRFQPSCSRTPAHCRPRFCLWQAAGRAARSGARSRRRLRRPRCAMAAPTSHAWRAALTGRMPVCARSYPMARAAWVLLLGVCVHRSTYFTCALSMGSNGGSGISGASGVRARRWPRASAWRRTRRAWTCTAWAPRRRARRCCARCARCRSAPRRARRCRTRSPSSPVGFLT